MKRRLKTSLLVAACAALLSAPAAAQWVSETAVRSGGDRVAPDRPAPGHPSALRAVGDCEELRAYAVEVAVETLLQARYGWWRFGSPWATPGGAGEDGAGGPSDYTGTNNQEEGVDELDMVKTDGRQLYVTEGDSLYVLRSWPPTATAQLARVEVGDWTHGLFLSGDRVLVFGQAWDGDGRPWSTTRLVMLDVSDPEAPVVERTVELEGWLADARMIDGHVYAVLQSWLPLPEEIWELAWRDDLGLPELPPDVTGDLRAAILEMARGIFRPLVASLFADLDLTKLLPLVRDSATDAGGGPFRPLLACDEVFRPASPASWSVLSVLHLDLEEPGEGSAAGLLADGWEVYASGASLYVAQPSRWWWWGFEPPDMTTAVHRFALDPDGAEPVQYVASGEVRGWVLDQFAMSEHEGHLRVASSEFDWWWGTTVDDPPASRVTVLRDDGRGTLVTTGAVTGIAPGEQLYGVRFMGDVGYLVTFEIIDPLFTLDLSDPTAPRVLGELEVTGYSSYLHPAGDGWLLAVGMEADDRGQVLGLAVSVFDVSDLSAPRLAHRYLLEDDDSQWSWSEALWDHHAFTFHRGVLSIPAWTWSVDRMFSGLVVLDVDLELGIHEIGRVDHSELSEGDWMPWLRRSVYIEDSLYSISNAGVKVNLLRNPATELAAVPFTP